MLPAVNFVSLFVRSTGFLKLLDLIFCVSVTVFVAFIEVIGRERERINEQIIFIF